MGFRIRTNVPSIFTRRNLEMTSRSLEDHGFKLASGYRINRAGDDPAGLAISEKMKSNIRGLHQALRNTADGVSIVQTAEGALAEIGNIVSRLRELSVQAASDTIGPEERNYLQLEFRSLKDEIDRIAYSTSFEDIPLLVGNSPLPPELARNYNKPPLEVQVGVSYLPNLDSLSARNPTNIIQLHFENINAMTTGEGSLGLGRNDEDDDEFVTNVSTKQGAQHSMTVLDGAIDKINSYRAYLGAVQNRFESVTRNTENYIENLSAANSRIRDTDVAVETAEFTKLSILQQAGIAVLSQANKTPELALKLLG